MGTPATEPRTSVLAAAPATTSGRRWWTLAGLSLASFLLTLGDTALAVALPSVGRDLELGLAGLEWVVNAYTASTAPGAFADGLALAYRVNAGVAVATAALAAATLAGRAR